MQKSLLLILIALELPVSSCLGFLHILLEFLVGEFEVGRDAYLSCPCFGELFVFFHEERCLCIGQE